MNALSDLQEKLSRSKRYRESWVAAVVKRMLPLQIRVLRKAREWSQEDLAKESQLTQGVISRAEDPDYGNLTINTLVRIAAGFDCAFVGRFVSYSELGRWYTAIADDKALAVPSFPEDRGFEMLSENPFSGNFAGSGLNNWPSAELTGLATMQTTKVSVIYSSRPIPRKEARISVTTTPHQPWMPPVSDVPYSALLFAETPRVNAK